MRLNHPNFQFINVCLCICLAKLILIPLPLWPYPTFLYVHATSKLNTEVVIYWQYPSEPRKSASMRLHAEKENAKEVDQFPSKSKRLLKALLSRRKSKKDDMLYTYLDEY